MTFWIINKLYTFWFVLGLIFPPFFIAFFVLPFVLPQIASNFKWLVFYIVVTTVLLYDWNYEVYTIPVEELEDWGALDWATAQIFTFFLKYCNNFRSNCKSNSVI